MEVVMLKKKFIKKLGQFKNNSYIWFIMNKTDLTQLDGMYYVGHLIDIDGSGYVDEETAELILLEHNAGVTEWL